MIPSSSSAADVFNHLILGYVVLFLNKQHLFPELAWGVSLDQLVQNRGFDRSRLQVILDTGISTGLLQERFGTYRLTALGEDLYRHRGFFTWAIGGYAPLLEAMDAFLTDPQTPSRPFVRGDFVAIGSDEANQGLMQPVFDRVIDSLPVNKVADLGCGNAGRLVTLLQRRPELTGVGIDIDPGAIQVAAQNRSQHGLASRLELVQEDVFSSLNGPLAEFEDVELVMSFMMLHDLFNVPQLDGQLFAKMKAAFPRAKYFVLADTCLAESRPVQDPPVFTLGYQLIHALRGIQLYPLSHYQAQFAAGGLHLVSQHDFGVPNTYLFVLEAW